jgi:hypothetical protein
MACVVEESKRNGYPVELRGDIRRFEQYRATVYRMLMATEIEPELTSPRCPVLVLGGSLDRTRRHNSREPWLAQSLTQTTRKFALATIWRCRRLTSSPIA